MLTKDFTFFSQRSRYSSYWTLVMLHTDPVALKWFPSKKVLSSPSASAMPWLPPESFITIARFIENPRDIVNFFLAVCTSCADLQIITFLVDITVLVLGNLQTTVACSLFFHGMQNIFSMQRAVNVLNVTPRACQACQEAYLATE